MSEFNHQLVGTIGVNDESHGPDPLCIQVGVDTLGMCVVSFGTSYSIRIPEKDVAALRSLLFDASSKLVSNRNSKRRDRAEAVKASLQEIEKTVDKIENAVSDMKENLDTGGMSDQQLHDVWAPNDPVNW